MIAALGGLVLPVAAAWLAVRAWCAAPVRGSALLTAALAVCLGVGASSLTTFWLALAGGGLGGWFVPVDALLWIGAGALAWRSRGTRGPASLGAGARSPKAPAGPSLRIVQGAFAVLAALAAATLAAEYIAAPHGQWDAWAIWNQKARFLVRGGDQWTALIEIPWSNPSHPILVSASVARLWSYAGAELTLVPALLSAAFGAAVVAAVIGALGAGRRRAWLAGAVLVSTWTYTHLMAAQTADLPVGLFMLAALILLAGDRASWRDPVAARRSLLLAGALAGLAAWTKNEGLVFIAVTLPWLAWIAVRYGRPRDLAWWAAGAAPALLTVAWYKLAFAPEPPAYMSDPLALTGIIQTLASPERHALVDPLAGRLWLQWGGPNAGFALPLAMAAAVWVALTPAGQPVRGIVWTAFVMLLSYYVVWLLSPLDAQWLVGTTFERLVSQVWPPLVLVAFWTGAGRVLSDPAP